MLYRLKLASDNGWKRSERPSYLHSKCAENHFGNKTKFSKKTFCILFGFIAQKNSTSDVCFSALFTKLRFASPEHKFDNFFPNFFLFFTNFQLLEWNCQTNSQQIPAQLSKAHLTGTDDHYMENWISDEMFNSFFYQFGSLSKKCVGLLTENFRYSCQNCILLVRRIILDEETFFL